MNLTWGWLIQVFYFKLRFFFCFIHHHVLNEELNLYKFETIIFSSLRQFKMLIFGLGNVEWLPAGSLGNIAANKLRQRPADGTFRWTQFLVQFCSVTNGMEIKVTEHNLGLENKTNSVLYREKVSNMLSENFNESDEKEQIWERTVNCY